MEKSKERKPHFGPARENHEVGEAFTSAIATPLAKIRGEGGGIGKLEPDKGKSFKGGKHAFSHGRDRKVGTVKDHAPLKIGNCWKPSDREKSG